MSYHDVAVAIIKAEHRSLNAVLHTLRALLERIATGHASPAFELMSAALYYINEFQERCHHPKEETYLFKALDAATRDYDAVIAGLQSDHAGSAQAMAKLHHLFVRYHAGAVDGLPTFKASVDTYAAKMAEHMRVEEALLEQSAEVISEETWKRIASAFNENDDPLFGHIRRTEFGRLYNRIVSLTPRKLKQSLSTASRDGGTSES